jgi:Rrf2 family protein
MKMSTKGRYGLRVMMELASHFGQGPLLVADIAKNQSISGKYIHVLVANLKSAGLVRAVRGPSGGYELSRNPSKITALEVISALEGRSAPVECVVDATSCPRSDLCAVRDVWCEVASAMDGVLGSLTLAQLASKQRNKQNESVTYNI